MGSEAVVSYIVVTYKRPDFLVRCLRAIRDQTYRPLEIIVVDNGDDLTDELFDEMSEPGLETRLLKPGKNLGPGAGRDLGMEHTQSEIAIFVDDDAILNQVDTTERVCATLSADPRRAAVTGYSMGPDGKTNDVDVPISVRRNPLNTGIVEVPYLITMLTGVRIRTIQEVGGFPPYLYCMEEYDLSLRLLDAKYKIVYDPEISVTHYQTRQQGHKQRHEARGALPCSVNRLKTAFKLLPFPYPWTMLFTRLFRLLWLSRFNLGMAAEYLRTLFNERATLVQARRPISPRTVRHLYSIGGWSMFV